MTQIKSFKTFLWEVARDEKRAFKLGHYLAKRHKGEARQLGYGGQPTILHRDFNRPSDEHLFQMARAHLKFGRWAEKKDVWDEDDARERLPKKTLAVKDLHTTQEGTHFNEYGAKRKFKDNAPILVAKHAGKHWIMNGHHRVMAHKLRGFSHIDAHVVDLDKHDDI